MYKCGKAPGVIDPCTNRPAYAIIVDGDSVLCTFHGSRAKENMEQVCAVLNAARQVQEAWDLTRN